MHGTSCNCPSCRGDGAREFEFEFEGFELGETHELISEQEELELATELLSVQSEQELEQFLGNVFRSVSSGLQSAGRFVGKNVMPVLMPALKAGVKAALPLAGGALGSLIPIPGVGTAFGTAVGSSLASALEMEAAGVNQEEMELHKARRLVRVAASAIGDAAAALGSGGAPETVVRSALAGAARRHFPGIKIGNSGLVAREMLSEQEELELATELLSVQSEQELEQFLGKMFRSVGRGLKSVGKFVGKNVLPVLGPALKALAKTALPLAGSALGSLIPIPGVGTMIGRAVGTAAANALEMEFAGLDQQAARLQRARRFVRLAARAIAEASAALGSGAAPEAATRMALTSAARRYIPGIDVRALGDGAAMQARPRWTGAGTRSHAAGLPSGQWRRVGRTIVLDGA